MATVMEEAFNKANTNKKVDYSAFIWKNAKQQEGDKYVQETVRLIDMSPAKLQECYSHCQKMLHNEDPKHLGRYNVLDEIDSQILKCNIELLLRYYENTYQHEEGRNVIKRYNLMLDLRQLMKNNSSIKNWAEIPITRLTSGTPEEFSNITVENIFEGCTDDLGAFNKSHLTMTFLTKMGIWFTKAEQIEFNGETSSNEEKLRIARERLHLSSKLPLKLNEKGLSFYEMRAMLTLPKKQKYSDMTTDQLLTLRNKVLLRLSKEVDSHIYSWEKLKKQIELVAKSKNIELV